MSRKGREEFAEGLKPKQEAFDREKFDRETEQMKPYERRYSRWL